MLDIELNAVSFSIALAIGHISHVLVIWLIHFTLHHQVLGISFWKVHLNSHHCTEEMSVDKFYYWGIIEHSTSALLWSIYMLACYLLLCQWMALTFIVVTIVGSTITYYLHFEYVNSKSWLNKYYWFQRDRKLHQIHHSYLGDQFSASKNYSFGGVMGHIIDRLVGTFEPVESANNRVFQD